MWGKGMTLQVWLYAVVQVGASTFMGCIKINDVCIYGLLSLFLNLVYLIVVTL